jgi:hypothetical protein
MNPLRWPELVPIETLVGVFGTALVVVVAFLLVEVVWFCVLLGVTMRGSSR